MIPLNQTPSQGLVYHSTRHSTIYHCTWLPSPRPEGSRSEISRRDDDRLHPTLMPVPTYIVKGEEELCAAAAAAGGREEVEVHVR